MKLLLDHCVTRPFATRLSDYDIKRAGEMGRAKLANGKLLAAAEEAGFAALITVDKGFSTQQNLDNRKISVLLLDVSDTRIEGLDLLLPKLLAVIKSLEPGSLIKIR